jgi:hypothetical protein
MILRTVVLDGRAGVVAGDCPVTGGSHSYSTYTDSNGNTVVYCINCESPR